MLKQLRLVCFFLIVLLTGCSENDVFTRPESTYKIDTVSGMIEYLNNQNLPALKSVENWQNNYSPGLKLTTANYEIYTTLLEPLMLTQLPGFVESAYRGYNKQLPSPIETTTRFKLYLFAGRKQWEDFTDSFTGPQAPLYRKLKAGAYYLNDSCVTYNIGRDKTFSIIAHEGWHHFNSKHFRYRLPSWLDEGIAMLFESSRYEKGMFYFEPAENLYRLGSLKITLMQNKMIPLKKLITMNPGEALIASDEAVTAFYGQSYALVRFLREEDYGKRLGNYHQMLLDGLRGTWLISEPWQKIAADRNIPLTVQYNQIVGTELFEHYICDKENLEQLEKEYIEFCRKIVYHVHFK